MAAPRNSTRANFVDFRGLWDARGLDGVPFGGFIESDNVDITRDNKPTRRPGRTLVYSGAVRDVWGDGQVLLFVTDTDELRSLDKNEGSIVLRSSVTGSSRISAARMANTVFWSYGTQQGVLEYGTDRLFGLPAVSPVGITTDTAVSDLVPGRYQYGWVVVTEDGEEGPLELHGSFELSSATSVSLVPPIIVHSRVTYVRAYLTEANGGQLYRLGQVLAPANAGQQAARHIDAVNGLRALLPARENYSVLPAFSAAGIHNGRLLVAYEDLLLYSERFDYEYYVPGEMFIPFSSRINIIAPVDGGVFVGTDTDHYFLSGADVAAAELQHKANYGAVAHTLDYVEQKEHEFEGAERTAVWIGARGPVFGLPGGQLEDSGDGVISYPDKIVHGAGIVRKHNGDMHFVSVIRHEDEE